MTGWPFFVASPEEHVASALDLAEVGPGMRVCDLGCGDGRLLLAAAQRGAEVVGVELDEQLAAGARRRLAEAGLPGQVLVGDLLADELPEADVYLAYLSPSMLQELVEGAGLSRRGVRLVTVAYRVPGLIPDRAVGGRCRHDLPGIVRPVRRGFSAAALLAVVPPGGRRLLAYAMAGHPAGPVRLEVTGGCSGVLEVRVGARELGRRGEVAVDLRVAAPPQGGILRAQVGLGGVGVLEVVLAAAEREPGWALVGVEDWERLEPGIVAGGAGVDLAAVIAARS